MGGQIFRKDLQMKEKTLSKKEKLFCTYFSSLRNAREAAALSGYLLPNQTGKVLLQKSSIKNEIERISSLPTSEEIVAGYRRIAFGSPSDCIKLIFKESVTDEELEQLDLFNISEIKKAKSGNIEIKFFDRIKALEHLENCENTHNTQTALPFYEAIRKGAEAIKMTRFDE